MTKNYYTEKESVLEQIAELRAAVADLSAKVGEILEAVRGEDVPLTARSHRHSQPSGHLFEVTAGEFQTTRELQRRLDEMGVTHESAGARVGMHAQEAQSIAMNIIGIKDDPELTRVLAAIAEECRIGLNAISGIPLPEAPSITGELAEFLQKWDS